jgi:LDH2 family malate/lactate/ureidoglycolate dehydrogenase
MQARMASFMDTVKASPMWDETKEMLLPGEIEYRTLLQRKERGIPLPENLYQELIALGEELGVESKLSERA